MARLTQALRRLAAAASLALSAACGAGRALCRRRWVRRKRIVALPCLFVVMTFFVYLNLPSEVSGASGWGSSESG